MNLAEAKEITERFKHLEKAVEDHIFHTELKLAIYRYTRAKGFLDCHARAEKLAWILEQLIHTEKRPGNESHFILEGESALEEWKKENGGYSCCGKPKGTVHSFDCGGLL